ncbi:MAG: hypothetical protein C3F13_00220 [Anaerolineales bacterium]|nr:MAG: hypothetical protein C3F13_00220 [Anaerolineales bacterium]
MESPHIQRNDDQLYHIKLDGILNSPIVDWEGDLSIIDQPENNTVKVCLIVHSAMIRGFLDQFQIVNLSVFSAEASSSPIPQANDLGDPAQNELFWNLYHSGIEDHDKVIMEK